MARNNSRTLLVLQTVLCVCSVGLDFQLPSSDFVFVLGTVWVVTLMGFDIDMLTMELVNSKTVL